MDEKKQNQLMKSLKNHKKTINDFADELNVKPYEIKSQIELWQNEGYNIKANTAHNSRKLLYHLHILPDIGNIYKISDKVKEQKTMKFAAASDLHFASIFHLSKTFHATMKYIEDQGIKKVYVAGDIIDGRDIYRGHLENLVTASVEGQTDIAAEALSKHPNLEFWAIAGNHDYSFTKKAGVQPMAILEAKIDNFKNLGDLRADIIYDGIKIRLLHGAGGRAYATCFDDETEIMTSEGWKFFDELSGNEEFATLSKKHEFQWQEATEFTDEEYEGEMVHFQARSMDLMVTPNHRMLVRHTLSKFGWKEELEHPEKSHPKRSKDWQIIEAKDLVNTFARQKWQMTKVCKDWDGCSIVSVDIPVREKKKYASNEPKHLGKIDIKLIAELIAWYVTEGHIDKKKNVCLSISQDCIINPRNWQRIVDMFESIGLKTSYSGRHNKNIRVYSTELCDYLLNECGSGSRNKKLPFWLKNCNKDIINTVFRTMVEGDGWVTSTGYGYKSISKQLLEDFAEIAIKLGYGITFTGKDSVIVSEMQIYPTINSEPEVVEYSGRIYCVSVPNGIIMVRRNGKTMWTGNSYPSQTYLRDLFRGMDREDMSKIPHVMLVGHYHTLYNGKDHGIHIIQPGSFQDGDNEFCLRRGLTGPNGLFKIEIDYENGKIINFQAQYHQPKIRRLERGKAFAKTTKNYK